LFFKVNENKEIVYNFLDVFGKYAYNRQIKLKANMKNHPKIEVEPTQKHILAFKSKNMKTPKLCGAQMCFENVIFALYYFEFLTLFLDC
jgi:hypothetical protein